MGKENLEPILQKDRSRLVRDLEYGDIKTHDFEAIDIPVKSKLEYDENGMLVFESFDKLDEYLENEFIPNNIAVKRNGVPNKEEDYFSIQLNKITKLRLNEKEMEHVFEYLKSKNIHIGGESSTVEADNYDYIRTYKSSALPQKSSQFSNEDAIKDYRKTKDIKIREQIIINNLRLVSWVAYKYTIKTGIDIHELESYGYEGLIRAVDNFDPNMGFMFSTYAVPYIRGKILRGLETDYKFDSHYYLFKDCKRVVEEVRMETIEENPKLLEEVIELMVETGNMSVEYASDLVKTIMAEHELYSIDTPEFQEITDLEDFTNDIEKKEIYELIRTFVKTLPHREQRILVAHFGLDGNEPKTQVQIAEELGISKSRASQIVRRSLYKIYHFYFINQKKKFQNYDYEASTTVIETKTGRKI